MTSQREAQMKEDLLLDLYKLNAYIPNDAEGNPLTPFGNFAEGYRVGQADQAATIAQLEEQLKDRDGDLTFEYNERIKQEGIALRASYKYVEYCDIAEEKIAQLQLDNARMREVLDNPVQWVVTNKRAFEHTCNSLAEAQDLCARTPVLPEPNIVVLCAIPIEKYEALATQPTLADQDDKRIEAIIFGGK